MSKGNTHAVATKISANLWKNRYLFLLALPGLLYFFVFKYFPMWGIFMAFEDYAPYPSPLQGILSSPWVGFKHFAQFFSNDAFFILLRNTLGISMLNLVLFFPMPIILSLLLNEVVNTKVKRVIQTTIYFPHFLSWVIIVGVTFLLFNQSTGIVNQLITHFGGESVPFLTSEKLFWPMLVLQNIWKDSGWGTIIYLAAITSIDTALYEAAKMDGASKWQQIRYVTFPGILPITITLLILRLGSVLDVGFEQVFLMQNAAVSNVSDVFETFVYRNGISNGRLSFSSAVGLFKSVIGMIMVLVSNKIAHKVGQEGLF